MRPVCVALLLFACHRPGTTNLFELRVAVPGGLEQLTPATTEHRRVDIGQAWVFETLARFDDAGNLRPVLAESIEALSGNRIRIRLRSDVSFSDGTAVSIPDVLHSLAFARVDAIESGGAIVVSSKRVPPELVIARAAIFKATGTRFIGTGAFVVEEESPARVVFSRRFAASHRINRVALLSFSSPKDAFVHTLKGDADLLVTAEPRFLEFFEGVSRFQIARAAGTQTATIALNPALDRATRRSVVAALANDDLRKLAYGEDCVPPSSRPGFEPLRRGTQLGITTLSDLERFALAARRALGPRGGEIRKVQLGDLFESLTKGRFDLMTLSPSTWPPSVAAMVWRTGAPENYLHYSNAAVDAAIDARDWPAVAAAMAEDPPAAFICTPPVTAVIDARIKNPKLAPYGILDALPEWEVSP